MNKKKLFGKCEFEKIDEENDHRSYFSRFFFSANIFNLICSLFTLATAIKIRREKGIINIVSWIRHIKRTKFKRKKKVNSVLLWKWSYRMCVCVGFPSTVRFCSHFSFQHFKCFSTENGVPKYSNYNRWMDITNVSIMEKSIRNDGILFYVFCERENTYMCVFADGASFQIFKGKSKHKEIDGKKRNTTSHSPLRRLVVMAFNFQLE